MSSELTTTNLNFPTDGNINASGNITITNSTLTTYTWPTSDATPNQLLSAGSTPGTMEWVNYLNDGAIQFNDGGGSFASSDRFAWDISNNRILIAPSSASTTPISHLATPTNFIFDIRNDGDPNYFCITNIESESSGISGIHFSDTAIKQKGHILYDSSIPNMQVNNSQGAINMTAPLIADFSGNTATFTSVNDTNIITTGGGDILIEPESDLTISQSTNLNMNITTIDGTNRIRYTSSSGNMLIVANTDTYTWPKTEPTVGQVLRNQSAGTLQWVSNSGGPAGGTDGIVQYGNSGNFDGVAQFLYDNFTATQERLQISRPSSTTAAIYTDSTQFTLDLRNDVASNAECQINIQGGNTSTGNGIRFSTGGVPSNSFVTYDYTGSGVLNISSQLLNITGTLGITMDVIATTDITCDAYTSSASASTIINNGAQMLLDCVNTTSIEGADVDIVHDNGAHRFDTVLSNLAVLYQFGSSVIDNVLSFNTNGSNNSRFNINGGTGSSVQSATHTTIDAGNLDTGTSSTQLRLFGETDSTQCGVQFIDGFTDPYSPEAIINYNHNADTFNISVPQNGNSMNFTLTNGSLLSISAPSGNIIFENSTQTITLPSAGPANVNGPFLRHSLASTPTNVLLEWSNTRDPVWEEITYTTAPFNNEGYLISALNPVLYLKAVPPNPTTDSSVLIRMESDVGQQVEIQYIRDTTGSQHTLSYSIPVFIGADIVMKSYNTDSNNSLTWTYDEVLEMNIDRSGANDIYNWTLGPTGDPVMTISRDTGTATTSFTMDIDNTGTGDTVVYSGGNIIRDTSLSKYKDNQRSLEFNSEDIYKLEARSFEIGKVTDFGYIAEEVEKINKIFAKYNSKDGSISGVKYEYMVVPIICELGKINDRILNLKKIMDINNSNNV